MSKHDSYYPRDGDCPKDGYNPRDCDCPIVGNHPRESDNSRDDDHLGMMTVLGIRNVDLW